MTTTNSSLTKSEKEGEKKKRKRQKFIFLDSLSSFKTFKITTVYRRDECQKRMKTKFIGIQGYYQRWRRTRYCIRSKDNTYVAKIHETRKKKKTTTPLVCLESQKVFTKLKNKILSLFLDFHFPFRQMAGWTAEDDSARPLPHTPWRMK